jgi:Bacterial Ig-like domain (group 2)
MKTTSRRFGRLTAPGTMDEGMGGGDYPTVLSDLSVDSPIRVIPDTGPDGLSVSTEPPQYVADDNFWGTGARDKKLWPWSRAGRTTPDTSPDDVSPAPEPPQNGGDDNFWGTRDNEQKPRPWWRASRTYFIATAVIAVLAVVATMLSFSGGSSQSKRVSYTFPVEAFPQAGVTVSRTWTIYGGKHPSLQGSLVFYSSRSDEVTIEELLPKSLVTKASQVTFLPKPHVVSEDPVVVSYSIAPALDGVTSVTYQLPIPGGDISLATLHRWASEQTTESGQRYLASHTLASVHITPASIVVKKGGAPYQLAVSGLQSDGQAAPTVAFGSATWSVANSKIAKVSSKGLVTGLTAGKTTVRAVVGKLSATANVVVSAAANVKATPPLKPLLAGPLSGLGPNSTPSSIGVLSTGTPVVTHHAKKPVTTPKPPVTHTPPPVTTPVTPPSPLCNTATMVAPSGLAATPSSTTAGAVSVSWGSASSTSPCPAVSGYTVFVDGVPTTGSTGNGTALSGLAGGAHTLTVYATFTNGSSLPSAGLSFVAPVLCSDGVTVTTDAATCPAPPPVCDPGTQVVPAVSATPGSTPGEVEVSWTDAVSNSPCILVTGYAATVDGTPVSAGAVTGLDPSVAHTLVVTAEGPNLTNSVSFFAPQLCSDGTTVAVATSCP